MEARPVARWYHLIWYPDWVRRIVEKRQRWLPELVEAGMVVADVGCGLGGYSVEMAKLVGERGRVLAVDFQPEMLKFTERKAKKAGLLNRITTVQCAEDDIKVLQPVDFVLTMFMTHEVRDRPGLFRQIRSILKPSGRYLLAEPKFHVKRSLYETICRDVQSAGFEKIGQPRIGSARTALFSAVGAE
jgi:ubiquinone/menaquinone biosynthesis C-methylase UbiE